MRLIAIVVILIVVLIYVLQNSEVVSVKFLFWNTEVSKAVLSLGTFLGGVVVGFLAFALAKFRKSRKS